jgi:YVTN family beta-propeller protein
MEAGITLSRRARCLVRSAALAALGAAAFTSLLGCGNAYRPVLSAINPVGPSAQPLKYVIVASSPSADKPGLINIIDFSGDTVFITANIGPDPKYLVLDADGFTGYVINGDGTLNSFGISQQLLTSDILQTTLLTGADPISIFPQGKNTYVTEAGRGAIAQFQNAPGGNSAGSPLALKQEFTVANPIYVVGIANGARAYALSQGSSPTTPGTAIAIDTTSNTPPAGANLPLGNDPVYGIMTADGKRAFIMNHGSSSVSVINVQSNQLDPLPGSDPAAPVSTINVGLNPIWADFAPAIYEMVVANAGDGVGNGSLSVVNIPLCNAASQPSNVNCDPNNPIDALDFGKVLATVPVGVNPVMVAALQDGTQAYVANAGNSTTPGSVSAINLVTNTVAATIPLSCHPNYIAATTGVPTGKVYVVCGDSKDMTVIRTDNNTIETTIPLQGNGVSVRITKP